jgi:hypothetical protein
MYSLACKGDTLTALILQFHHYLAGFSNSTDEFCFFLTVISVFAIEENSTESLIMVRC